MINTIIYSYELSNMEFKPNHPFKPIRSKILMELLNRYDLLNHKNQMVVEPLPLKEELLYLFHERKYIELLRRASKGEFSIDIFYAGIGTEDNPIFESMYEFSILAAGGTFQGAEILLSGTSRVVFNPIGGFHHAGKGHAEGFCYINDIAITITDLIQKGHRVACIDIDAHHGNGVQDAFYDTDKVLTISLHESGETLYPGGGFETELGKGKGEGYNVNIPLLNDTDDDVYVYAFDSIVPPLIERYKPDFVVAVIGSDTHKDDPLTHMKLTTNGYKKVIATINDISPKILALGAGGYNIYKTTAMWALAWATFCGLTPTDLFAGVIGGFMYGPEAGAGTLDDPPFSSPPEEKKRCLDHANRVVSFLKERLSL
ncbi:MAG: acetoin utilization protein AcuC [Syntrophorhabdaceae bacterium]|nr:acetoin utilization protein AcuC [Syntrophorhabdaceae bacterium]